MPDAETVHQLILTWHGQGTQLNTSQKAAREARSAESLAKNAAHLHTYMLMLDA